LVLGLAARPYFLLGDVLPSNSFILKLIRMKIGLTMESNTNKETFLKND